MTVGAFLVFAFLQDRFWILQLAFCQVASTGARWVQITTCWRVNLDHSRTRSSPGSNLVHLLWLSWLQVSISATNGMCNIECMTWQDIFRYIRKHAENKKMCCPGEPGVVHISKTLGERFCWSPPTCWQMGVCPVLCLAWFCQVRIHFVCFCWVGIEPGSMTGSSS